MDLIMASLWGALFFRVRTERYALLEATSIEALGNEWNAVPTHEALTLYDRVLCRDEQRGVSLSRLLAQLEDRVLGAADEPAYVEATLREALASGRLCMRRSTHKHQGPPPKQLDPVVLADPEPTEELTFITFDLFDQTGARLEGMPYELEIDGEVVDAGSLALGHVHRDELEPGTQGTLRLPELAPVADQTLVITFIDEQGQPMKGESYELLLADGTRKTGALDDAGRAELSQLPKGKALLSFPKLEQSTGS
jgi:hypothetical protein